MKAASLAALLSLVALLPATNLQPRNYAANDYYVVHLERNAPPIEVANSLGLRYEGPLGSYLKDHYVLVARKEEDDVVKRQLALRRRRKKRSEGGDQRHPLDSIRLSQKQVLRKPWEKRNLPRNQGPQPWPLPRQDQAVDWAVQKQTQVAQQLGIQDPIFRDQWHLFNTVQIGHDVNVTDVWLQGVTGKNVTVAIVDDGLDMYSDDLKDNYYAQGSYDFNDKSEDPKPRLSEDRHGTRCAGEVSAVVNNVCGVGVAYESKVAGLRILSKLITDADEAVAMNYDFQHNDIYSCSWGPPDDGRSMDAPGILIRRAMLNAVQNGRGGLGSIYVFASGNGAANDDNCNFDGYTNSIYSITIGAVDRKGQHPYYSEKCSAGLVVTYSSGSGDAIHTTDVGQNACYSGHGGTSAAAPLAAGIFALVLQVRPDLSWRDMQYLAMDTAVPINLDSGDWQDTTIGKRFSHTYGYGKIDTFGVVEAAKAWKKVKPQAWFFSPWIHVFEAVPQGEHGIAVSFDINPVMLEQANFERVEHVTVTMNVNHTRRGDLSVDLVSPDKVVSHLSVPRRHDNAEVGYIDWTFMSVVHWGESGLGTWTIIVKDTQVNEHNGTLVDWHLKLWGECRDLAKAKPLPMPEETDDDNHAEIATTTLPAVTTKITPLPTNTDAQVTVTPSDHPNRPVNSKPTSTTIPTQSEEAAAPTGASSSSWISWLPSFGMSAKTQAWVYGALALIVAFCAGLGVYLWMAHRKRVHNANRDDYQFELLDEEDIDGPGGEKAAGGPGAGGKRRTRGGELYDAFAGGSDGEEDEERSFYRDRRDLGHDHEEGTVEKTESCQSHKEDKQKLHVGASDDDDEEQKLLQARR